MWTVDLTRIEKWLGHGLFELREMSLGYRLYFYFDQNTQAIVIVVATGEKDTQERDIKRARGALK